ncbi:MAG TPA: hypothetical protein VGV37_22725 [Aliidongia sp.]|uniref:hypothetical protein n=1 Tax=Aliidongia sp. TaxID=1914230 RepID=UPI002DDD264F|nr:hypothetical protein [Aliidongia sp.]HEV2677361.1 hypothetical protein [Aliidongia sp.]
MTTDLLILSLRETRLILERLVQAAGAPPGLLPSVRDCALYSAILPGDGFAGIAAQLERLGANKPAPLRIVAEQPMMTVDCGNQHAWLVADGLLDLAVDQSRRTGQADVKALHLVAPEELRIVAGLAERYGLEATAAPDGDGVLIRISPRPVARLSLLDKLRFDGVPVSAATWWPLYEASHAALAPDSFESRRHAGTVRVEADGRIVGRPDEDETDLSMLAADPTRLRRAPVSSVS